MGRADSAVRRIAAAGAVAAALLAASAGPASGVEPIIHGVSYGPSGGEVASVFPQSTGGATMVVLVHGGGWRLQKAATEDPSEAKDLQKAGFVVFDPNYDQAAAGRLAFPMENEEIALAAQYAIEHAAAYGATPSNVILLGGSAGGELAARAAEELDSSTPGAIRAVVSLSGPMNLQALVEAAAAGTVPDRSYVKSIGIAFGCSGALTQCPTELERQSSPSAHIPAGGCPAWMLIASTVDGVALTQGEEMLAALESAQCTASLDVLPSGHGFSYWKEAEPAILAFLRSQ